MLKRINTVFESTRALATLTGLLTFCIFSFQEMLRGVQPFGTLSTQINDKAVQFVPFAAEYRRILLHTTEISSYNWTWAAGGGVPMHGNIATYDGGLLIPLILILFPQGQIELAFFVITGLSYALAASFTVLLLRKLHQQLPAWITVLLAAGYGLSSWALQDANYMPMWLSGLYMLPLLGWVALRAVERQGFFSGVLIVAYTWWANFYTAYMASLGAGIFLIYVLLSEKMDLRKRLLALVYFVTQGILGVLLSAVAWLPTLRQVLNGIDQPGDSASWERIHRFFGHSLPWAESLSRSPSFAVTTFTLLLALLTVSAAIIPPQRRIISALVLGGLVFSFAFPKTVVVWNLFDSPNGNLWRATFVVAFLATVIASYSAEYLQKLTILDWSIPATGLLMLFIISSAEDANRSFKTLFALSIFVLLGLLILLSINRIPRVQLVLTLGISVFVVLELIGANAWMLKNRDEKLFSPYPRWEVNASREIEVAEQLKANANFPLERTVFGVMEVPDTGLSNKGFLLSVPTVAYYSSVMPNGTLLLADGLGVTSGITPRHQSFSQDPFANALMGATQSSLHCNKVLEGDTRFADCAEYGELRPLTLKPLPFAHLIPASQNAQALLSESGDDFQKVGEDIFSRRNRVVGTIVYKPVTSISVGNIASVPEKRLIKSEATVAGQCPAGTVVTFDGSKFHGKISSGQSEAAFYYDLVPLERFQDATGGFNWTFNAYGKNAATEEELEKSVSCFDRAAYETALKNLTVPSIKIARNGEVNLTFASPVFGTVVLKMPVSEGYKCKTTNGTPLQVRSLAGLAALEISQETSVDCGYQPPWFRTGLLVSVLSLLVSIGIHLRIRR